MANKKEQPRRWSLNDLIDAAVSEDIDLAGINAQSTSEPEPAQPKEGGEIQARESVQQPAKPQDFPTKKATTIMPKEVFTVLQRYCMETETPKHRVIYRFIIDGLLAAGTITEEQHQRFREMASQITATYEKK
jgi:hypothetical protein